MNYPLQRVASLVVVAPRLKPRKPGNDQLNETSSALMHSLAGCLPAGITYRLYDSRNYPQITQLVPMCALPPLRSSVYLWLDNNRSASNATTTEKRSFLSLSNSPSSDETPANNDSNLWQSYTCCSLTRSSTGHEESDGYGRYSRAFDLT